MQNKLTSTCQYQSPLAPDKACPHPPLKGDRDNFCIFHSRNDKKGKGAFWDGIQDKLKAEDFDFESYYFPPGLEADFGCKEFKDAKFIGAIFKGDVNFNAAEFSGEGTDFSLAEFSGESTDFSVADFSGCGTVRFVDTVFEGECKFLEVKFPLRSDQFVIFAGTRNPIDLGNTVFLYSNYDRITFRNCKFREGTDEQSRLWRRRVILKDEEFVGKMLKLSKEGRGEKGAGRGAVPEVGEEELLLEEAELVGSVKVEYSHVESLYRQFKKNLEAEKDWELAGEFHYGEMECNRKGITSQWPALEWARQNLGLLAWYKYFSGYGERPFRTSCWIVFLLPFFALLYSGIDWWLDPPRQCFWNHYFWNISVKAAFLQRIGETGSEPTVSWVNWSISFNLPFVPH